MTVHVFLILWFYANGRCDKQLFLEQMELLLCCHAECIGPFQILKADKETQATVF